jgi:hemerythrin
VDNYIIKWNEGLSVGDDYIDAEHRKFVELIRGISEYASSRDGRVLTKVLHYATTHFADEESYMERLEYPGLQEHRSEHKKLTRILLAYKKDYDRGRKDLYAFKQFAFRWVRDHIMDVDRRIAAFVSAQKNAGSR